MRLRDKRKPTPREEMLLIDCLERLASEEHCDPVQVLQGHGRALEERRLVEAIITRACMDVCDPLAKTRWERAARWINCEDDSDSFEVYCFYLKVNPEAIRERLVKLNAIPKKGQEYDYAERRRHRVRWRTHRGQ